MLTNPGGPGSAGRYLAGHRRVRPAQRRRRLRLDRDRPARYRRQPSRRLVRQALLHVRTGPTMTPAGRRPYGPGCRAAKRFARACGRSNGTILDHMTTVDSARDLERDPHRARARQINFYGFSYGTYLGQVYATLFPTHIARDGARQQRRPDAGSGTARTSTRTRAFQTQHQDLVPLARQLQRRLPPGQRPSRPSSAAGTASATSWPSMPITASARTSGPTSSSTPSTTSRPGSTRRQLFAGYVHHHSYKAMRARLRPGAHNDNEFAGVQRGAVHRRRSGRRRGRSGRTTTRG